uniref:DDE Tnp4 domain-containing protein n=1 Tax=Amphimedon queenslandica TaxID=400682 RepID=A0A1X7TSB2_AMPQE
MEEDHLLDTVLSLYACRRRRGRKRSVWVGPYLLHRTYILSLRPQAPSTEQEWIRISRNFRTMWNFPNCIGAMDVKHIVIQASMNAGFTFYSYKGTHSIVCLAVCDAKYSFRMIDIGEAGRQSDSGIFTNCQFCTALEEGLLNIPPDKALTGTSEPSLPLVSQARPFWGERVW